MTPMKLGMKRVLCDNGIEHKDNQDLEEIKQSQVVKKQKSQSVLPANQTKLKFVGRLSFTQEQNDEEFEEILNESKR